MSSVHHVAFDIPSNNSLGSERQRVYTDAHALRLLTQPDIDLDKLDLIEELENSSMLKPTLLRYLKKAAQLRNELRSHIDRGDIYVSLCLPEEGKCLQTKETIELIMEALKKVAVVIGDLLKLMTALAKEEIALDSRLASVKWLRKVYIYGCYTVLIVTPLLVSTVLDSKKARICTTVAAILMVLGRPLDWFWDKLEKELEGTRDVVKTMRRLAFNPKDKFDDLQALAHKLREDVAAMRTRPLHEFEIRMLEEQIRRMEKGINQCAEGVERAAVDLLKYVAKNE